jgi:peroxiredoxin
MLSAGFSIPAARGDRRPLRSGRLRQGVVVVSTLPNISKQSCIAQIVDLEEMSRESLSDARVFHVSADEPHFWKEVDESHPHMKSPGYSLHGATPASRAAFVRAFGVEVEDQRRIAHGLFALSDGIFLCGVIPMNQLGTPDVRRFLLSARRALARRLRVLPGTGA